MKVRQTLKGCDKMFVAWKNDSAEGFNSMRILQKKWVLVKQNIKMKRKV